jgi:cephalosporin hydroxylase
MDYRDYFRDVHKESIGVYFYDADHLYEHQYKALELANPYMASGSYIIIDDAAPGCAPYDATVDFIKEKNGTYEVVLDVQTPHNCHPTFWGGLLILKKKV